MVRFSYSFSLSLVFISAFLIAAVVQHAIGGDTTMFWYTAIGLYSFGWMIVDVASIIVNNLKEISRKLK